jgi:hypothetical protein
MKLCREWPRVPTGSAPESGIPCGEVLSATNQAAVEGDSFMQPGKANEKYAFHSWSAQFVEVKGGPEIAKVTVSRVVSAFDTPNTTIATAALSPVTWLTMLFPCRHSLRKRQMSPRPSAPARPGCRHTELHRTV